MSTQVQPAMPSVSFVQAAHEHQEPGGLDFSYTPGANSIVIGPTDVPANGYLRHIFILCQGSGGVLGAGVPHPDFPFNIFSEIAMIDVNGAQIVGPVSNWQLFLMNLHGGYVFQTDPRMAPDFNGTINFSWGLRIPVEIMHNNGLGAMPNQSSAAQYKYRLTTNVGVGNTGLFTTAPTTLPIIRVRTLIETWTLPAAQDGAGRTQMQAPPRVGTTQFWSVSTDRKSVV